MIFGILFFISIPLVWSSLFFTNYQGDLTRIGKWMDSDFGGQIEQPVISPDLLVSSPINEADVLVIGDSFSESLHWQSVLTQSQIKVSTLLWSQIGEICEDFPQKLQASGFHGNTIIIESIERVAERQFEKSVNCKIGLDIPMDTHRISKFNPLKYQINLKFNIHGQFIAGLQTIYHSVAIRFSQDYPKLHNYKSKETHIYPLEDGCDYFSNKLCKYGLFFHEDYSQPILGQKSLADIDTLKKRLRSYRTIWVIVPNKSSVYQREISGEFWEDLEKRKLGPNLYLLLQSTKKNIKDLYAPNDTHFSNSAYLLFGQKMTEFIAR